MDRPEAGRRADREELRRRLPHPYITRQEPGLEAADDAADEPAETQAQPQAQPLARKRPGAGDAPAEAEGT